MKSAHKVKMSKGAGLAKIKWDESKHKREAGGRFAHKPGTEEFKAEPFGAGKTSGVVDADVIKLHVKANPKKPGSAAATDFAHYQDNMTVGEFKAKVGPNAKSHLTHDTGKGFITIHDPKTLPPVEKELAFSDYVITSKTKGVKPEDKIKLLSTTNPKKPGSKAAEDFAKYKDEMTVAEFHTAVGDKSAGQGHILHDLKKGYISVHDPAELKAMKTGAVSPGQVAAKMNIGDKDLGSMTTNPFTTGTKNHQDFEDEAKKLGLVTKAGMEAPAVKPAAPGAQPEVTTMKKGESLANKKAFEDLADDDIIVLQSGTEYKVKDLKSSMSAAAAAKYNQNVESGAWKVKPKQLTTHGLNDNDIIESYLGNKYTVGEWKQKMQGLTKYPDTLLTERLNDGTLKIVSKAGAGVTSKPLVATTKKLSDIPLSQQHEYDLTLTTDKNPYPHGSNEYIKFQSLAITNTKTMSVQKYYTTKALTETQKTAAMQQIIDDGHVKIVPPEQKAAVAAQKAKFQQEQAKQQQQAVSEAAKAQQAKYKLHFEQIKPADWHNDPKWSKVPGFKTANIPLSSERRKGMEETRKAIGLTFNGAGTAHAVQSYTGSGYATINGTLRNDKGGFDDLPATYKGYTKKLDSLMGDTQADVIMWRGQGTYGNDPKNFNNIPPPHEFVDMGFTSMSHNPNKAKDFAGQSIVHGTGKTTVFRVRVPKGTKAAFISRRHSEAEGMADEAEIIVARGSRYKYISTTRNVDFGYGPNVDVIEIEVIQDNGANMY